MWVGGVGGCGRACGCVSRCACMCNARPATPKPKCRSIRHTHRNKGIQQGKVAVRQRNGVEYTPSPSIPARIKLRMQTTGVVLGRVAEIPFCGRNQHNNPLTILGDPRSRCLTSFARWCSTCCNWPSLFAKFRTQGIWMMCNANSFCFQ